MKELTSKPASGDEISLELGKVLGQGIAFGTIAGRCSAAQAGAIAKARSQKIHARFGLAWKEFCSKHFKMSGTQADQIIRLLDEFGPGYFENTQSTRISPQTYRLIAPFIHDKELHYGMEVLDLNSANVQKVAQAVRESLPALPAPADPAPVVDETPAAEIAPAPEAATPADAAPRDEISLPVEAAPRSPSDRLADLGRHINEVIAEFRDVSRETRQEPLLRSQFRGELIRVTSELQRVSLENGLV